jgi:MftR C-terminal domain
VMAQYDLAGEPDRDWVARTRLVTSAPGLRGEFLKAMAGTEQSLAEAIARRCGTEVDLFARVVAAMVTGATRVGVDEWLTGDTGEKFGAVVSAALRLAVAGID